MKINILSDLHLEFGQYPLAISGQCLLLAGDTIVVNHLVCPSRLADSYFRPTYREFFDRAHRQFDKVYVIMGNHEFYHGEYHESFRVMRQFLEQWNNITLLENQHTEIAPGWRLWGATMWTDFRDNPLHKMEADSNMNDFEVISWGKDRFTAARSAEVCGDSRRELTQALSQHSLCKWIVMTHHAPSGRSVGPRYRGSSLNPAFHSDWDELIELNPEIAYWIHGHMHTTSDYWIGETRVICNPRGYFGREQVKNFQPNLIIDLKKDNNQHDATLSRSPD